VSIRCAIFQLPIWKDAIGPRPTRTLRRLDSVSTQVVAGQYSSGKRHPPVMLAVSSCPWWVTATGSRESRITTSRMRRAWISGRVVLTGGMITIVPFQCAQSAKLTCKPTCIVKRPGFTFTRTLIETSVSWITSLSTLCLKKTHQLWKGIAQNCKDRCPVWKTESC